MIPMIHILIGWWKVTPGIATVMCDEQQQSGTTAN